MSRYPTRRIDSTNFSQNDDEEGFSRDQESKSDAEREGRGLTSSPFQRCPFPIHGDSTYLVNGVRYCGYCGEEIL